MNRNLRAIRTAQASIFILLSSVLFVEQWVPLNAESELEVISI
jgi:hypothetical protein